MTLCQDVAEPVPRNNVQDFVASEAAKELNSRWVHTISYLNDQSKSEDERPKAYSGPAAKNVWGQSKLALTAAITDFATELNNALAKSRKSSSGGK